MVGNAISGPILAIFEAADRSGVEEADEKSVEPLATNTGNEGDHDTGTCSGAFVPSVPKAIVATPSHRSDLGCAYCCLSPSVSIKRCCCIAVSTTDDGRRENLLFQLDDALK